MALSKEIYQALEDIVGPLNITNDPTDIEAYRSPLERSSNHIGPFWEVFTPRAEAVLLPATTEEVQAIVKLCNKYGLKMKASSTYWSAMGYPVGENTIMLDMRRMERIWQIDEKNQFAVIEPYVIGATLQAEAMKVGLNTHMIGAGAGCSPLASLNYIGIGADSMFMAWGDENLLGAEWITPSGDIVRTGTLGSGVGWHYGEGPGPSVRGIMRGMLGPMGALGVLTKVALKLYPWPGPATLPVQGASPVYTTELPDNFSVYSLGFPSWEAYTDAIYKIWDAGLGYIVHRQYNKFGVDLKAAVLKIVTDHTKTLTDLEALINDSDVKKHTEEAKRDFEIVLAGMTARDIEWQEKALNEILAETGGWKVSAMNDPLMRSWSLLYLIRMGHKNLNFIFSGGYEGGTGMVQAPGFGASNIEKVAAFKKEWEAKGQIVAVGGDSAMGSVGALGGGGIMGWEVFTHFDSGDKESSNGTCEYFDASNKFLQENKLGACFSRLNALRRGPDGRAVPQEIRNQALAHAPQPAAYEYQRKVKDAFDPNDLGDVYYHYVDLK